METKHDTQASQQNSKKVMMVTGATAGIGKMTALGLAKQGAHVVLVGRNEEKCQAVQAEIEARGQGSADYFLADLSSIEQTVALGKAFTQKYQHLDVLVNNVGAIFMERGESVDGFENTFALNHLVGYFLLTNRLLPSIVSAPAGRIICVSSDAHYRGDLDFNNLQPEEEYSAFRAYSNSKLMNVMFAYELARRLEQNTTVTVNALHPGVVASNFGLTNNRIWWLIFVRKLFNFFSISEKEGAETSLYLATSPEVADETGQYYADCKPKRSAEVSYNQVNQHRLWRFSEKMLEGHLLDHSDILTSS